MNRLHLAFLVDSTEYVLPADDVLHMESFEGTTPVPGAPPYVAGLVQIRGRVVPVLDLRARFGSPPAERALGARVLVVRAGERVAGLLVDSAREVLDLRTEQFAPPPEVLTHGGGGFIDAVAQLGARLLMRIDVTKVLGQEGTTNAERRI